MGAPKPFEGWPSRTAAVLDMRRQGMSTKAIASRIGIPAKNVSALEYIATGRPTALGTGSKRRTVYFSAEVLERARPHAARRGIAVTDLVRRLVDVALDDNLVDGILDDESNELAA